MSTACPWCQSQLYAYQLNEACAPLGWAFCRELEERHAQDEGYQLKVTC